MGLWRRRRRPIWGLMRKGSRELDRDRRKNSRGRSKKKKQNAAWSEKKESSLAKLERGRVQWRDRGENPVNEPLLSGDKERYSIEKFLTSTKYLFRARMPLNREEELLPLRSNRGHLCLLDTFWFWVGGRSGEAQKLSRKKNLIGTSAWTTRWNEETLAKEGGGKIVCAQGIRDENLLHHKGRSVSLPGKWHTMCERESRAALLSKN